MIREYHFSGRGAAWLARLHGVQEVAGSNPVARLTFSSEFLPPVLDWSGRDFSSLAIEATVASVQCPLERLSEGP